MTKKSSQSPTTEKHSKEMIVGAGIFAAALIGIVTLLGMEARLPQTPIEAAKMFCKASQARETSKLKHLLTPSLLHAWEDAETKNAEAQKAAPDDKPPFGDGIPTQAFQDYAENCMPGKITTQKDVTLIEIRHEFPKDKHSNWTDRLALKQDGIVWLIDDIHFAPKYRDTLRKTLAEAFK